MIGVIMSLDKHKPWLTFDCYDTLVRYTESKSATLEDLVLAKGGTKDLTKSAWLAFEASEKRLQKENFLPLNQILRSSLKLAFETIGINSTISDENRILSAVKDAEPFSEVAEVLSDLKHDYRLAILSNSEPDIIRFNIARIGVTFDEVVLASQAKCYKPSVGMFNELIQRINESPKDITHIAQSFYHDMRTAKDLGFGRRIWVNRYKKQGDPSYTPDAEISDISRLREELLVCG